MRTHTKPLGYETRHHPTSSSTLCRTPHLNNKQAKIQTQSLAGRITTSRSLTHQRKNNNNSKTHTNLTLYEAYINHRTNLRRTETKRKKEFSFEAWERETSNTISLKKNNEKAEKHYTNEGTTRNMEVKKKNEGDIGRLLEDG